MSLENSYLNDPDWEPSISVWYKIWCPFCETPNWFSDNQKYDIEGVDCWECHRLFWAISFGHRKDCYDYYLEPDFGEDKAEYACYDDVLKNVAYTTQGQKGPK